MQNSSTNKIVLVTEGTSGIGKATALAFAEAGAKVVITCRREKDGADVAAEITKTGGSAAFVRADAVRAIEDEVAKAVLYLASDDASNITGAEIVVDGTGNWSIDMSLDTSLSPNNSM